jgi:flagella basal body P-ring formation protein FlgA
VTIIAQRGSLKVQVSGKALENGERGQLIRLMNLTSQKEIAGEVIGNKLVRINF